MYRWFISFQILFCIQTKKGAGISKDEKESFIFSISDFWWDAMGWVALGGIMAGISYLSMPSEPV